MESKNYTKVKGNDIDISGENIDLKGDRNSIECKNAIIEGDGNKLILNGLNAIVTGKDNTIKIAFSTYHSHDFCVYKADETGLYRDGKFLASAYKKKGCYQNKIYVCKGISKQCSKAGGTIINDFSTFDNKSNSSKRRKTASKTSASVVNIF